MPVTKGEASYAAEARKELLYFLISGEVPSVGLLNSLLNLFHLIGSQSIGGFLRRSLDNFSDLFVTIRREFTRRFECFFQSCRHG